MAYARHLRSVIRRTPLDYSVIQVFVKWIVQRSTASSPNHDAIHNCARLLEGVVSLRSGLLLVDIWAALASLRPSDTSKGQVSRLAHARNQVSLPSHGPCVPDESTVDSSSSTSSSRILELMSLWMLPQETSTADNEHLLHVTDVVVRVSPNQRIIWYRLTRATEVATGLPRIRTSAHVQA